jgi:hypothetical protein
LRLFDLISKNDLAFSISWSLNEKEKVDPICFSDLKVILPSNFSTIFLAITSPSPIPFLLIYWSSCTKPNNLKSFSWSNFEMPIPVSYIEICKKLPSIWTSTWTLPFSVNLRAFDWRPSKTCMILFSSLFMIGLTLLQFLIIPFFKASTWESSVVSIILIKLTQNSIFFFLACSC